MENEITDAELEAMQARADAATPGEWINDGEDCRVVLSAALVDADNPKRGREIIASVNGKENANHITAANPHAVKRLVTALRAARKRIAELEKR